MQKLTNLLLNKRVYQSQKDFSLIGLISAASLVFSSSVFAITPSLDDDNDGIVNGPLMLPIGASSPFFLTLQDNCIYVENPQQLDYEQDGLGDLCDDDDMSCSVPT